MSATYDKLGLQFMYPENWEIMDEDAQSEPRSVTIQNETGAFWSITVYESPVDTEEIAELALEVLREEYEELEVEAIEEQIGSVNSRGFDVQFYVQQLVAAARIRTFLHDGQTVLLLCQAEDREFDRLHEVFQAMTLSLLQPRQSAS